MKDFEAYDFGRLRVAIAEAIGDLDVEDRAQRIAYCVENDVHGVSVEPSADGVTLRLFWAGRLLTSLPLAAFARYGATPGELS